MSPESIKIALFLAGIGLAAYLVIHYHVTVATVKERFAALEAQLGLVHAAAIAPVSVTTVPAAPAPSPAAAPAPAPATPAPPAAAAPPAAPPAAPVKPNPIEELVKPAPTAAAPVAPPEPAAEQIDPDHPDPAAFGQASGRWMRVVGSNSLTFPIGPGHYTFFVGEGEKLSGTVTVDGVSLSVPGKAFTVDKPTTASLSVTGNGTIALSRLAVVVATGKPLELHAGLVLPPPG